MTTIYTVTSAGNSEDVRAAASAINRRLGDAGDTRDLRAVEAEIASCHPSIRDALRIESESVEVE